MLVVGYISLKRLGKIVKDKKCGVPNINFTVSIKPTNDEPVQITFEVEKIAQIHSEDPARIEVILSP
jgi:hypothetical protein